MTERESFYIGDWDSVVGNKDLSVKLKIDDARLNPCALRVFVLVVNRILMLTPTYVGVSNHHKLPQ